MIYLHIYCVYLHILIYGVLVNGQGYRAQLNKGPFRHHATMAPLHYELLYSTMASVQNQSDPSKPSCAQDSLQRLLAIS